MTTRDIDRVTRIMDAFHAGELDDVQVYALLAQVRTEAIVAERERFQRHLEALACEAVVSGHQDVALALAHAAEGLTQQRGPRAGDVADA